jgi:hypothetical protein
MSCSVRFQTQIKDRSLLAAACDNLRSSLIAVTGPRLAGDYAYVRLPDWRQDVRFDCGAQSRTAGEVYYDSDYVGPRAQLDRLTQAYVAAALTQELAQDGCYIQNSTYDEQTGLLRLQVEVPEALAHA